MVHFDAQNTHTHTHTHRHRHSKLSLLQPTLWTKLHISYHSLTPNTSFHHRHRLWLPTTHATRIYRRILVDFAQGDKEERESRVTLDMFYRGCIVAIWTGKELRWQKFGGILCSTDKQKHVKLGYLWNEMHLVNGPKIPKKREQIWLDSDQERLTGIDGRFFFKASVLCTKINTMNDPLWCESNSTRDQRFCGE